MTDPRQCWQCGGTGFRLVGSDSELQAECIGCGTEHDPANTYIPTDEDEREDYEIATGDGVTFEMKSIECPNCGMPFDVPAAVDHWSCDCGASWELDPRTDGGSDFDPADYDSVRDALREAPAGYGAESIIDYFDPVVEDGHEVDADV